MKFHHLAILSIAFFLSSCSKDQTTSTEEDITVSSVPERVASYVDNNYPDSYISSAVTLTHMEARTIVTLNTTEELAFNQDDNYMGSGGQFHTGHHHSHGGQHGDGHGHCHGFEHGQFHPIPLDSLSSAITTYIGTNYAGYQIIHAEYDSLCSAGSVIEVHVRNGTLAPVKLIFDIAGNFLMSASRIDYSATPAAVQSSIVANYPGYTPRHRSIQFTLANSQIQYGVFLFNGTTHKRVILADDGTVICEQ